MRKQSQGGRSAYLPQTLPPPLLSRLLPAHLGGGGPGMWPCPPAPMRTSSEEGGFRTTFLVQSSSSFFWVFPEGFLPGMGVLSSAGQGAPECL